MATVVKKRRELTLRDRLSRLSFVEAGKLLGENGSKWIRGGTEWDINIDEHVRWLDDEFRVAFGDDSAGAPIHVAIRLDDASRDRLKWACSLCGGACQHVGAVFSLILEEKTALGLAEAPPERVPLESLSEEALIQLALAEREERAKTEKMQVTAADANQPWTDYTVTSVLSGKSYKVALRGLERGDSYCSCPDFRTNTLGTCKHILHVLRKMKRKFAAADLRRVPKRRRPAIHVRYGRELELHVELPNKPHPDVETILGPLVGREVTNLHDLLKRLGRLERDGHDVVVYPDAEELIQQRLFQQRMETRVAEIRRDPAAHPLRRELLKTELLPYQLDGIAFAAGVGRAVLADDMGLGKTIQGVGVAEFLAREADIRKVLVVCPASLKSQWRNEIHRFSGRDCQLVVGPTKERHQQYNNESFFTICNYEQVLRDILAIEQAKWDLIILDEGQRIKNWEAKTARVVKGLKSQFAIVLSGTPLENRLDDLYSIVEFIDSRRLAPAFRFFNRHRVVDEKGKVLGYKNLTELRETLRPILLRRTRDSVKLELPPRTTETVRIPPTDEQREVHASHMQTVAQITRKKFLTEMDLLRLQKALLMCRMAADSTVLVDKQRPGFSSKLEHLDELLGRLFDEEGRKVVLFSEWTTMLDLIQPLLDKRGLRYVRLDGSVPQKERQQLVHDFQTNADCRLFLSTNAGSTGLNLQAANTVINVDLPWNPAVLEQRISRAHRMGQTQPVQVFVLVTEETLEDNLLTTLSAKHELALAALDPASETDDVELQSGMEELKRRLEVLLGAKPAAPVDESQRRAAAASVATSEPDAVSDLALAASLPTDRAHRDRVAAAGGELLGAAFKFLGELIAEQPGRAEPPAPLVANLRNRLTECVEEDSTGRPRLTFTLRDRSALDGLAETLARLLTVGSM
jgi:ERCC4-related helicase